MFQEQGSVYAHDRSGILAKMQGDSASEPPAGASSMLLALEDLFWEMVLIRTGSNGKWFE